MDLNLTQAPASKASFIELRQVDLAAGIATSVNIYGRVFYCSASTGPFEMNFNDGEFFPILGRGVEWALIGDDRYSRLQFRAAVATALEFYGGNFAYHENVVIPVTKVAQTVIRAGPIRIVALGDEDALLKHIIPFRGVGLTGSGLGYRKTIIVTNLHASADLDVYTYNFTGAVLGDPVATVFPRQAWVCETSANLALVNLNAGELPIRVMEIFYPA